MSNFLFGLVCITSLGEKRSLISCPAVQASEDTLGAEEEKVEGVLDLEEQHIC